MKLEMYGIFNFSNIIFDGWEASKGPKVIPGEIYPAVDWRFDAWIWWCGDSQVLLKWVTQIYIW